MAKPDIWVRHVMDKTTREFVEAARPDKLSVCEVSGSAWKDMFAWRDYTDLHYPEFDICQDVFPRHFDLIIVEQVFEHIRSPWKAARNIYASLNTDGYALITVPFMFHIHPTPLDCWRWTPQGLGFMFEDAGFKAVDVKTGGWGNYECFLRHAIDQSSAPSMDPQFSLHNVPHIPIQVWGFAKKTSVD